MRCPYLLVMTSLIATAGNLPAAAPITSASKPYPTHGSIERLDPALDALLVADAKMEKLAEGFNWSEGPVWMARESQLVFSDVPENIAYRWKDGAGISIFLQPSGFTGEKYEGRERGSNGLTVDHAGKLALCQHGDRRVARLNDDAKSFTTLADRWDGKRFNSPNDLCFDRAENLFFTDPPYGMQTNEKSEIEFNGVFRRAIDGKVTLISRELERPNGIALSVDQKTLYVANSHGPRPIIMAFALNADGTAGPGTVFWDSTDLITRTKRGGAMDGMKVDEHGNLWATGPGGVLIISPTGKHLGTLLTERATANCAFGGSDGRTLFITADDLLLRITTKVKSGAP
jgi:gluconolactonase